MFRPERGGGVPCFFQTFLTEVEIYGKYIFVEVKKIVAETQNLKFWVHFTVSLKKCGQNRIVPPFHLKHNELSSSSHLGFLFDGFINISFASHN
jgi:hypothetical protein